MPSQLSSNQSSQPRVLIVGAGPSGSSAAFHLLENGVEDVLVLDKAGFPRDKLCGGGLTRKAQKELDRMGIYDEVKAAAYAVPKPYIVLPSGTALYARPRQEKLEQLLVLNRRILDEMIMKRARQRGAEIREGVEVKELVRDGGREDGRCVGVRTGDGELISADVVVVAAGARSGRLRPEGASPYEVVGLEGRYRGKHVEQGIASLIFDKKFVPEYGWVFPESEEIVNVGVAGVGVNAGQLRERLDWMVSQYLPRHMEETEVSSRNKGFPIHASFKIGHLRDGNVLYVGEAGCLADPLSLEGISQALISGRFAAGQIAAYLQAGDESSLSEYSKIMQRKLGHYPYMRWLGKLLQRRAGAWLVETALRRTPKWLVDEERFAL